MAESFPKLYADDRGVWHEDSPGQPFGMAWGEIIGISGHKLDGITDEYTVVELDHPSGHWLELHTDAQGFAEVAQAITARLPGITDEWLVEIERLQLRQAPMTVWRRADPGAAAG